MRLAADGAGGLAYLLFRQAGMPGGAPSLFAEVSKRNFLRTTARNIVYMREIAELSSMCDRSGFPVILLKGASLLYWCYDHPGARGMSDIDLLVDRSHLRQIGAILTRLHYRHVSETSHHVVYAAKKEFDVIVEVHTKLFRTDHPIHREAYMADTRGVAGRAVERGYLPAGSKKLSDSDEFLFMACHAVKERFASLKHFADLYYHARATSAVRRELEAAAIAAGVRKPLATVFARMAPCETFRLRGAGDARAAMSMPGEDGLLHGIMFQLAQIEGLGAILKTAGKLPIAAIRSVRK